MKRLVFLLVVLCSCGRTPTRDAEVWATVTRGDLEIEVDVSGVLRAKRAVPVSTPTVLGMWDFKIVRMAPEGSEIKEGAPVLFLDPTDAEKWLIERATERDRIAKEVSQKENDLELGRKDADLQVAEADATRRKADLKADLPAKYTAEITMKLAKLDSEAAAAELRMARRRREQLIHLGDAELNFLRQRLQQASARVQEVQAAIRKLTVRAPASGLVVYKANWRGEKKKVGDSFWGGEVCLEIADISDIVGTGQVEEIDSAQVAVGQTVNLHLEAFPELEWTAHLARLKPNVFRQSPKNPIKVIGVEMDLSNVDRARMRLQMQFRGRIEVERLRGALIVPLDAVFTRPSGPVAFRKTPVGFQQVPVKLGRKNRSHVEVLEGLVADDRVSRRDLENGEPRS